MTDTPAKTAGVARRKWTNGRGALVLIAVLFAASAAIRLGTGAGPAIAKEVTALKDRVVPQPVPAQCAVPDDIAAIMAALQSRQDTLDQKENQLLTLEQSLGLARTQIEANLIRLEKAENELSATISATKEAAESDLARLTAVYQNMKPKDAASLFGTMDPEFAAGFIGRMRPDAAAKIMTGLDPDTAYTISVILAGRNADAPGE